jgi:translocation and assembly module TamB
VGQAIANPLADRLSRVFGVTQLKIAPTFVSGSSLPQARITLQQQVRDNVTFTYSQDLNQANSQLVRVELQLTPQFSAVATRDENGIFGVDFYWRKQFH